MLRDLDLPPSTSRQPITVAVDAPTALSRDGAAARAGLYRTLAAVFAEEPDAPLIDALRAPESLAALEEAGLCFAADFLEPNTPALLEALAIEYSTLFVASGGFPPIESARLTGRLQQDPYHSARNFYRRLGFRVQRGKFHVFEDHLGVELMFVAELLARLAFALDHRASAEARRVEREIKKFWALHLGLWVRGYARLLVRAAEHSFYREMARLLEAFANSEIDVMRLRIADEDQGRLVVPKIDPKLEFNPDEPICGACGGATAPASDPGRRA